MNKQVTFSHTPVLLEAMLEALDPQANGTYLDATFGGGGYTEAILNKANCKVIALDRDPQAAQRAEKFKDKFKERFSFIQGNFGNLDKLIPSEQKFDGIVFDFGVSSYQLDDPERGFSFRFSGPLDMRMSKTGLTAAEVVNTYSQENLAKIIWTYGEEKKSRSIAKAIVEQRKIAPFLTTVELADLIRKIVWRKDGLDPATLTFQALRIFVNNELIEIDRVLNKSISLLPIKGKIVAVTFQGLEDRIIKNWIKEYKVPSDSLAFPVLLKKIVPTLQEIEINPRCRSAKLRKIELVPLNTLLK